ncbi:hypothetical protein LguiB_011750 [Lonicera macranthoides]
MLLKKTITIQSLSPILSLFLSSCFCNTDFSSLDLITWGLKKRKMESKKDTSKMKPYALQDNECTDEVSQDNSPKDDECTDDASEINNTMQADDG